MNWYDRPELYDALFSWDPGTERDFVLGASERYGIGHPKFLLEPFCGTGRMLRAMPGTIGFDINPHMLRVAAERGSHGRVFCADAARFAVVPGRFDAAFCLIDSFRYLLTADQAGSHLRNVAQAIRPGAVYILGFDLAGDTSKETWEVGNLGIEVGMLGDDDPDTRLETLRVRMVRLSSAETELESFQPMRTYTPPQVRELIAGEGSFELAAAFDRRYRLDAPRHLDGISGSVVLVLRKTY